jgi:Undecaprenyl-phosphate glucose phosphotransferase
MSVTRIAAGHLHRGRSRPAPLLRGLFKLLCVLAECGAIVAAALLSYVVWQALPFASASSPEFQLRLGLTIAVLVAFIPLLRNEYRSGFYLARDDMFRRTLTIWNMAFVLLFLVAFATRRTEESSRGAVAVFYALGFVALWSVRVAIRRALRVAARLRLILAQRILVVGTDDGIDTFAERYRPWNYGYEVVGMIAVRASAAEGGGADLGVDLDGAFEIAREMGVAEVYVAVPWSQTDIIDGCLEAFLNTPVAIHLAPEPILDRFDRVEIARVGPIASLELTRPMSASDVVAKRCVDVAVAGLTLVLLLPLLALVAILIKLDSPGPVFFRQTRYGFNQRPFRILKFRSMTCFEDDADVPQATPFDPRVTRIGRFLRRSNIDELPQLFNVLAGQMSLVGPRPHAVPHNRAWERRIALYARRHNVRPGITGWAQVNGLRGETDTEDKMRRRVAHDLYYIDNWSMMFDLRIIVRTIVSPKAYRNAH